jgi:NADPH-dependent 2,4-dienoyl-CoA reductase/sulfur reductase-like enzyme
MDRFKYLVIGGGMAAGYAAKEMVKQGMGAGELCILSADTAAPYNRPPLSKEYLIGTQGLEKVFINKDPFYQESGIDLRLEVSVETVDLEARQVRSLAGEMIGFEKLLFATGSSVRRLDMPGGELEGVLYLRTLDNCRRLKEAAAAAKSAVVVGGGFIGTEVAARLADFGPQVTFVYRDSKLLSNFLPPEMSALYEGRYRAHDVRLVADGEVTGFVGSGKLEGVKLASGEVIPAHMAVVGVGVTPNVQLAQAAGLEIGRAILVNEYLETEVEGVFAAGDVADWYDVNTKTRRHVEHELNARNTARHAARVMLGGRQVFDYVPMFWSQAYDISWDFWGETKPADQVVYRGELESASFGAWWLQDGAVVGALVTEDRYDTEGAVAQAWVKAGKTVDPKALADESKPLEA